MRHIQNRQDAGGALFNESAFTLIELMLVIAIVGILVTIALPSYQHYTRKAHYAELVQAAAPLKVAVEQCYQLTGSLNACHAGEQGIPDKITLAHGSLVHTTQVKQSGVILISPWERYGIHPSDTYILTPHIVDETLRWSTSGGGRKSGYVQGEADHASS